MPYKVENIVRKAENACYNVFHSYISLVHQNASLCGNVLNHCEMSNSWTSLN